MEFNTVMERLYAEALQGLLHGMNGMTVGPPVDRQADRTVLEPLPLKFLNSAWSSTPPDEHVRTIAHWHSALAAYRRWFQRELAPEAMLALTDRALLLIAEEKAGWSLRISRENKYGDTATYIPLSRLREARYAIVGVLGKGELVIGVAEASEAITIEFPTDHLGQIRTLLDRAFREKSLTAHEQ